MNSVEFDQATWIQNRNVLTQNELRWPFTEESLTHMSNVCGVHMKWNGIFGNSKIWFCWFSFQLMKISSPETADDHFYYFGVSVFMIGQSPLTCEINECHLLILHKQNNIVSLRIICRNTSPSASAERHNVLLRVVLCIAFRANVSCSHNNIINGNKKKKFQRRSTACEMWDLALGQSC